MNSRIAHIGLCNAMATELIRDAGQAPTLDDCMLLVSRAEVWATHAKRLAEPEQRPEQRPEQLPEDTAAESAGLLEHYADAGASFGMAEPCGRLDLIFNGELTSPPEGYSRLGKSKLVRLLFRNGCGGSATCSVEIARALAAHGAPVTAHVETLCASAHVDIFLAASRRTCAPKAKIMVHQPRTVIYGGADDLECEVARLRKDNAEAVARYAAATGQPVDVVAGWMPARIGTWFTAEAALAAGLVHRICGV